MTNAEIIKTLDCPYYEDENILFLNTDCMKLMELLPDKFFDLILTDPPYNVGISYNEYHDSNENYYQWCDKWFDECIRISETQVLTTGYKNLKYWINKKYKGIIYWIKPNQNSPSQLGGFNCVEHIFYFGKLQKRIGQDYFIKSIGMQEDAKFHPVPKYLPAWNMILNLISGNKNFIYDPFCGSGSTLIACMQKGLKCIGTELDADYFNDAVKRIKLERAKMEGKFYLPEDQNSLFGDLT